MSTSLISPNSGAQILLLLLNSPWLTLLQNCSLKEVLFCSRFQLHGCIQKAQPSFSILLLNSGEDPKIRNYASFSCKWCAKTINSPVRVSDQFTREVYLKRRQKSLWELAFHSMWSFHHSQEHYPELVHAQYRGHSIVWALQLSLLDRWNWQI